MKWLCIIAGIFLLLAIPTGWPYDFYILLRWLICITSAITAYGFYGSKLQGWSIVFGAIAILFNPLYPVYLAKSNWVIIDFFSSILFFMASYSAKSKNSK